jgi:probable rRNA maturation factor
MDPDPTPHLHLALQTASRTTGQPTPTQFRRWAKASLTVPTAVTIRLVDSREGHKLNQLFRHKDYATNVLTFVYGDIANTLHGDLVLCAPVVKREAKEQKKPLLHHYAHLVVHGLLHLQGHDHQRKMETRRMEKLEIGILQQLGIPNPYLITE